MDKNKTIKLTKHLADLQTRLSDLDKGLVPEKHKARPTEYRQFLVNEISSVKATLSKDVP
jgi:hypothetical protein